MCDVDWHKMVTSLRSFVTAHYENPLHFGIARFSFCLLAGVFPSLKVHTIHVHSRQCGQRHSRRVDTRGRPHTRHGVRPRDTSHTDHTVTDDRHIRRHGAGVSRTHTTTHVLDHVSRIVIALARCAALLAPAAPRLFSGIDTLPAPCSRGKGRRPRFGASDRLAASDPTRALPSLARRGGAAAWRG